MIDAKLARTLILEYAEAKNRGVSLSDGAQVLVRDTPDARHRLMRLRSAALAGLKHSGSARALRIA